MFPSNKTCFDRPELGSVSILVIESIKIDENRMNIPSFCMYHAVVLRVYLVAGNAVLFAPRTNAIILVAGVRDLPWN